MAIPIGPANPGFPSLPSHYLPRARLDRQWAQWSDRRLVLVNAGAGFGKTSFLAANARAASGDCLWYSLDEINADITTFCNQLLHLVRPKTKPPAWAADQSDPHFPDRVLTYLVNRLRSGKVGPRLILDDLQLVAGAADIMRFLDRLIRFIPENATLILASREQLALSTIKLRAMGAGASLSSRDLAFNSGEVRELFLRHFPQAELSAELSRRIIDQTEGWAAGVEIFFQLLEGTSETLIEDALERMSAAGPGWFAYFTEEVVRQLDSETQDFLRRSSILPRLDALLCDRVLGLDNSREILERLCRRSLFTYRADSENDGYRYHHLFREFLRDQMRQTTDPVEMNQLKLQAARELENVGGWAESTALYAEGGDFSKVLALVEKHGDVIRAAGHYELLRQALEAIPANQLDGHPAALITLGHVYDIRGRWVEAEQLYRKALDLLPAGARRTELSSLVATIEMRQGNYDASLARCGRALDESGQENRPAQATILSVSGVSLCERGDVDEGERHFKKSIELHRENGDARGEGYAHYLLAANVYQLRGEFQLAKEAARRSLHIFNKLNDPYRICRSVGVLGFVMAGAGEVREARELNEKALRLGESLEDRMVLGYGHLSLGRCALMSGELSRADDHFRLARRFGELLGEMLLLTYPLVGLAELALIAGNHEQARRLSSQALDVNLEKNDLLHQVPCHTVLGLAELKTAPRRAAEHWARGEKLMRRLGAAFDLHRLLLIRLDTGTVSEKKVPDTLMELLSGAAGLDHDFIFLRLEPSRAARVLPTALRLGVETGYAARLLNQLGEPAVSGLIPLTADPSDEVRARTVEVLTQIGGDQAREALGRIARKTTRTGRSALRASVELGHRPAVPLKIHALGSLVVSYGEHRLSLAEWTSARALRLFQLLLVNRFRWVHRDVAVEWLWQECDPDKGANNLRQTIHLLRKTLEPGPRKTRDSSYIRFLNEACRLEPGNDYFFDVEAFEGLVSTAEEHWSRSERNQARNVLEQAADLYRGNFLEESPFEEFTVSTREELREKLLRVLVRLAELYAEAESWVDLVPLCRKGLAQDPYHEEFYWHLVRAQYKLGNRREALTGYHQYEEMMARELELLPSVRMKELADQVIALGRSKK